jgi:hypothetical protein
MHCTDAIDCEFDVAAKRAEYERLVQVNVAVIEALKQHLANAAEAEDILDEFYMRTLAEMPTYADNMYDETIPKSERALSLRLKKVYRWSTRIVAWMKKHRGSFEAFACATTEQFNNMSTVIHKQSGVMTQFMRRSEERYTKLAGGVKGAIGTMEERDKYVLQELETAQRRYEEATQQIQHDLKLIQTERLMLADSYDQASYALLARIERLEALCGAQ